MCLRHYGPGMYHSISETDRRQQSQALADWQGTGSMGMPCTQCAHIAKFWMSANTRTLVSAPFHKFFVPDQVFF